MNKDQIEVLAHEIVGSAIEVHKQMGPGLLECLLPVNDAQLLSYLKLADINLGFLINFNVPLLKNGIKRMVNNY